MTTTTRTRTEKAPRLTAKRKEAIEKAELMGHDFNVEIFNNPITHSMSIDELIDFSMKSVVGESGGMSFTDNIAKIAREMDTRTIEASKKSFDEIYVEVEDRFKVMEEMALSTALGINPAVYFSGAAGVGKSTTVMNTIESLGLERVKVVKGKVSSFGLYSLLHEYRHEGSVIVFDDSDSIFDDEDKLNILKAVTDSSDVRTVSWITSKIATDSEGEELPAEFDFKGSIIFLTNYDIYAEASSGSKMSVHFKALISRSFVLDLAMPTKTHYLARIKHVLFDCIPDSVYNAEVKQDMYDFMVDEQDTLRELSLRMLKKMSVMIDTYGAEWKQKSKILLCK
jgi:hypothetical protein